MMITVNLKIIFKIVFLITLIALCGNKLVHAITKDSRVRTYVYNDNEVFPIVLHYGFQSYIEFDKNEHIQTITLGEPYAWKISNIGNKLFIKPLEKNIRTNMIILTDKRSYKFDVLSKELEDGYSEDLVYVLKFYYPGNNVNK